MPQEPSVGRKLGETLEFLQPRFKGREPIIGIILGSGLGDFASSDYLKDKWSIPYAGIPHFPVGHAIGHAGMLWSGRIGKRWVVCMQGRAHPYEGFSLEEAVHPVRTMGMLGVRILIASNAVGSLNLNYEPGTLVIIRDHINFMGDTPLNGPNPTDGFGKPLGPRFPDMDSAYTARLLKHARKCASELGQQLPLCVYAGQKGPCYETGAETATLGNVADIVGMSVVHEVIAAHHMGMATMAISCVTNWSGGISRAKLDGAHVAKVAKAAGERFMPLVERIVRTVRLS